jgi:Trk K+ transport system NAD-binding subunit
VVAVDRADIQRRAHTVAAILRDDPELVLALVHENAFGTAGTIARVHNPDRTESRRRLGIGTVFETTLAASAFLRVIEEAAEP